MLFDEADDFDYALAEAIRQGRVIKTINEDGETVYKVAEAN